jgi:hypothetical protein
MLWPHAELQPEDRGLNALPDADRHLCGRATETHPQPRDVRYALIHKRGFHDLTGLKLHDFASPTIHDLH